MIITKEVKEISNLPAGPALDLEVALALGWKCVRLHATNEDGSRAPCEHAPFYSVSHLVAFQLRLDMEKLGWTSHDKITWMGWGDDKKHPYGYSIWFEKWEKHIRYNLGAHIADCEKAPLAVARAALLALTNKSAGRDGSAVDALKEAKKEGIVS